MQFDTSGQHELPTDGCPGLRRAVVPGRGYGPGPANAPVVVFDREDDLQHHYLRLRTDELDPPVHHVPSSADFLAAVALGLGWGMLPDLQSAVHYRDGRLVDLDPDGATDVTLHWQQWRLRSPTLDRVADAVLAAAGTHLDQPRRGRTT